MKSLNTMKFVTSMTEEIAAYKKAIAFAETYERAKTIANKMLGYIDCAITFLNTMICTENNDFTAEFDEVLEDWESSVYDILATKAAETLQSSETIFALLKKRDEVRA